MITDGEPSHVSPSGRYKDWRINGKVIVCYIENDDSTKWYQNDMLHKCDGPAVIRKDGSKEWWLVGIQYEPTEWMLKVYELGLK